MHVEGQTNFKKLDIQACHLNIKVKILLFIASKELLIEHTVSGKVEQEGTDLNISFN